MDRQPFEEKDLPQLLRSDDTERLRSVLKWLEGGMSSVGSVARKEYICEFMLKSARLGCPESQYDLSYNYFLGRYFKQNMMRSCCWGIECFKSNKLEKSARLRISGGSQAIVSYLCASNLIDDAGEIYVGATILSLDLLYFSRKLNFQKWAKMTETMPGVSVGLLTTKRTINKRTFLVAQKFCERRLGV